MQTGLNKNSQQIQSKLCKEDPLEKEAVRSVIDRRSDEPRRKKHNLEITLNGSNQRRHNPERRRKAERRAEWMHLSEWSSVFLRNHA